MNFRIIFAVTSENIKFVVIAFVVVISLGCFMFHQREKKMVLIFVRASSRFVGFVL